MNNEAFYSDKKKRVYEPGEEFYVQVTDDSVELVTKEAMGELPFYELVRPVEVPE